MPSYEHFNPTVALDPLSAIQKNVSVTVRQRGSTTLAAIYSSSAGAAKANPFTTDATTGSWDFYAKPGPYDLLINNAIIPVDVHITSAFDFHVSAYGAVGDGVADDTAAIQAAVNAAQSAQGTVHLMRRHKLSNTVRAINPVGIAGSHRYGTKLFHTSTFPVDAPMLHFERDIPGGSLTNEEYHVPGVTLRDFTIYSKRDRRVNGIKFDYFDRIRVENVMGRWLKGSLVILNASVRESMFAGLYAFGCGDVANDRPVVDMRDRGSADGHNNNRFEVMFSLTCGDGFIIGAGASSTAVRANFIEGTIHGWPETQIVGHDNEWGLYGVAVEREAALSIPVRIIDGSHTDLSRLRLHHQGRGLPLVALEADDSAANNSAMVSDTVWGTNARGAYGYAAVAVTADPVADTLAVDSKVYVHRMSTGSRVWVAGTAPGGLATSTNYYVIRTDATTFKLATSRANAFAGTAIDITSAGSGVSLVQFDYGVTVDATTDTLTAPDHILRTGARVRIASDGGSVPAGLAAATDYFVINTGADTFKLAVHKAAAKAGTAIDITGAGTGSLYLTTVEFIAEVDTGTLSLGLNDYQSTVPKRAYVRTNSGATTTGQSGSGATSGVVKWDALSSANVEPGVPFVENHNAVDHVFALPASISLPNNISYGGSSSTGAFMALMRVSAVNQVLMGNLSAPSGTAHLYANLQEAMRLAEPTDGNTALLIRRNVGGTLSLQQVSMGAADSGGAGFKVLRVPN